MEGDRTHRIRNIKAQTANGKRSSSEGEEKVETEMKGGESEAGERRRKVGCAAAFTNIQSCQSLVALATHCSAHLCVWLVGAATVGGGNRSFSIWKYLHTPHSS